MSESSTYQEIRSHLAYLRLGAAAEALPGELDHARENKLGHSEFLHRLLKVGVKAAIQRCAGLERFACLPSPWTLDDFDFSAQPSVDKKLMSELGTSSPRRAHQRALDRAGRSRARRCWPSGWPRLDQRRLSDLLHDGRQSGRSLPPRRPRGEVGHHHALLRRAQLLVIDEVGYLPLQSEAAAALFQVIAQRYLKSSIVMTTNLGVGSWGKISTTRWWPPPMLDRLLHRRSVRVQHQRQEFDALASGPHRRHPKGGSRVKE